LESQAASRTAGSRISQLDGLRGLAILMVISLHYLNDIHHGEFGTWSYKLGCAFRLGWLGVDLFFVLSGFLIGRILLGVRESPYYFRTFYLRRLHRIVPIYYLLILLYLLVLWCARVRVEGLLPVDTHFTKVIPIYFAFLQNYYVISPPHTLGWFWFLVTWSLAVEEQFYLVAPPLIRFLNRETLKRVLIATLLLAPLFRFVLYTFLRDGNIAMYVWTPCRADSLALGVLTALLWEQGTISSWLDRNRRLFHIGLMVLAVAIPLCIKWIYSPFGLVMGTVGYSWFALFFAGLIVWGLFEPEGVWGRFLRNTFLREMGCLSYCLYLVHWPVLGFLHAAILGKYPNNDTLKSAAVTGLALAVSYGIAKTTWHVIEKPLIDRAHTISYRKPVRTSRGVFDSEKSHDANVLASVEE
jgi:peptidoglycan/LPS O-acetylase OafA/YrhL